MLEIFYNPLGYNTNIFILINHHINTGNVPYILQAVSNIFFIANFAIMYLAFCIYFYFQTKKSSNPTEYFETVYHELTRIGICYALFGITFAILKFSINLPRPFCSLPANDFTTIADIATERCLSSFPSAHTGLSILVAYILWPYTNKILKTIMLLVITLVALSRIALAMHYPADIIYSAIITIIVIIAGNKLYTLLLTPLINPIKTITIRLLFK